MDMNFQTSQNESPKTDFFYFNLLLEIHLGEGFLVSQYVA